MAKTEVCKNCCTGGGAIFVRDFGIFPHHITKVEMTDYEWVKVCSNCGHYKPFQKRKPRLTLDEIMELPNDESLKSARDLARFHYFSKNGSISQYKAVCDMYRAEAEKNGISKYALRMHPYFNDYHEEKIVKASMKKNPNARETRFHISEQVKMFESAKDTLKKDYGVEYSN